MRTRSGKIYQPRIHQRSHQRRRGTLRLSWNTARGRKLAGLPLVPFEIQEMIIRESFKDPAIPLQDITSRLRVCSSWNEVIKKDLRISSPIKTLYNIIRQRFSDRYISLYTFVRCFQFNILWAKIVQRVLHRDAKIRTVLVFDTVRYNDIKVARILFGECGVDVKERFPWATEINSVYGSIRMVMHAACFYGHVEMVKLLADEFGALEGQCKDHITDLIRMAADQGNVDMWIVLEMYRDRASHD